MSYVLLPGKVKSNSCCGQGGGVTEEEVVLKMSGEGGGSGNFPIWKLVILLYFAII